MSGEDACLRDIENLRSTREETLIPESGDLLHWTSRVRKVEELALFLIWMSLPKWLHERDATLNFIFRTPYSWFVPQNYDASAPVNDNKWLSVPQKLTTLTPGIFFTRMILL